jgi:hypothetical protein
MRCQTDPVAAGSSYRARMIFRPRIKQLSRHATYGIVEVAVVQGWVDLYP